MTVRNLLVVKEGIVIKNVITEIGKIGKFKDSAHFCYCAYVLRILRYSGFLWVVPTNTGIFLCGLKLWRKQNSASSLGI